jgi:competence protein ComEC
VLDADDIAVGAITVRAIGTIVSAVTIDGDRAAFTAALQSIEYPRVSEESTVSSTERIDTAGERVAVQVKLTKQEEQAVAGAWTRGQKITLQGSIEQPAAARNFGGFDYNKYLRTQRIHLIFKAAGASSIEVKSGSLSGSVLLGEVDKLRQRIGNQVEQLFPGWQAGYMKGLLIGLADDMEPDKYIQFTQLGLTHILAISGSHVAINVGLLFGLLRLCRVTRETSILIVLCFVPIYVLLTGFSPSVIRAGIMTILGLYLLRQRRMKDGLNVLSAAALLMLLWEPNYLLNVSFQLSFAVTAGLIIFVPLILPLLSWLPSKIRSTVAITVAAEIVSFPLTIYYFNQLSLLSLVANLLIVPVIGLIALPLGMAALLTSLVWLRLGTWIAYPVILVNKVTFQATEWLTSRSGFMTYWQSPGLIWIAGYYLVIYGLLLLSKRSLTQLSIQSVTDDTVPLPDRPVRPPSKSYYSFGGNNFKHYAMMISMSISLIAMLIYGYRPLNSRGVGHVQYIDVGQGDCTLITTPSGVNILVDGGGTVSFRKPGDSWRDRREPFEVGAKTVVPLLKKRGIHRLDIVIATHGDQDHIGGLQAVIEQFPIGALLFNGSFSESKTLDKLMQTAVNKKTPIYAVSRGMILKLDSSTRLEFIAPLIHDFEGDSSDSTIPYIKEQNPESVVFRLDMDGASFLFTGDTDEATERKMLALEHQESPEGGAYDMRLIDILKVSHHGSKTSTSALWVRRYQPTASVISAGINNTYGHPNAGVVERLAQSGSSIFRTDLQGEIQVVVRKGSIQARYKNKTTE